MGSLAVVKSTHFLFYSRAVSQSSQRLIQKYLNVLLPLARSPENVKENCSTVIFYCITINSISYDDVVVIKNKNFAENGAIRPIDSSS